MKKKTMALCLAGAMCVSRLHAAAGRRHREEMRKSPEVRLKARQQQIRTEMGK